MTDVSFWQEYLSKPENVVFISIAPVAAVVTWLHVWMALKMVFYPIDRKSVV